MTVVIDPVYVQLFLRSATRFIPHALFHTLYSARFIPSKAVSLVVTVFGESNEPCSTSLSLCVPGSRLTEDPCTIRLIFLWYFIFLPYCLQSWSTWTQALVEEKCLIITRLSQVYKRAPSTAHHPFSSMIQS